MTGIPFAVVLNPYSPMTDHSYEEFVHDMHKIVYSFSWMKNGVEVGQVKVMEIVTIHDVEPLFIEYATLANDYEKYLPIAQKMMDSFQFTDSMTQ